MLLVVRHIAGSLTGTEQLLDLEPGQRAVLGRLPECDIVFDAHQDIAASARHAAIECDADGTLWVSDLNSSNGTFVAGARIDQRTRLAPGAVLELGQGGPRLSITPEGVAPQLPGTAAMAAVEPPSGGVGAQTVALMIGRAQRQSSRRFLAIIGALAVLVLAAVAVIVYLAVRSDSRDAAQQAELDEARGQLDETRVELDKTRQQLEQRLETERTRRSAQALTSRLRQRQSLEDELAATRVAVSDEMRSEFEQRQKELVESLTSVETRLSEEYGGALYMLGFSPDDATMRDTLGLRPPPGSLGFDAGFCTAFAVTPDGWLATNAHCIDALIEERLAHARRGIPVTFFAKRNGDSDTAFPLLVETAAVHPGYTHVASEDVGMIKIDLAAVGRTALDRHVHVADAQTTRELAVGQPIYMLGFPGRVMDPYRVAADFRGGNIARLTNFDSELADAEQTRFVWHTALTSKGTSGSPMFDREGRVVAVNNGILGIEEVVTQTGDREQVKYLYSAEGLNFGVRTDALHELAARVGVTLPPPDEARVPQP